MDDKQFTKAFLQQTLRPELEQAVKAIGDKHGLDLTIGNIRYDSAEFTAQVRGAIPEAKAERDAKSLAEMAKVFGLDETVIGPKGEKLTRYDMRSVKTPWIFERDGKLYKTTTANAKILFAPASTSQPSTTLTKP